MLFHSTLLSLASVALLSASTVSAAPAANHESASAGDLERRSAMAQVVTTCKNRGEFAMTFDDGPHGWGSSIAQVFTKYNSHTTFFVNGYNYDCIYDQADDLIKRYNAGHTIASHTWNHFDVTQLSDDQIHQQLDLIETALKKILGIKPKLFRPPYGAINERAAKLIESRGYTIVTWDFDSNDSDGHTTGPQSVKLYNKLANSYPKPHIALNHEVYKSTGETVVPQVVPMLLKKGYKLVTVDACLGINPYQSVGKASKRDKTWTCQGTPKPHAD
ncbi:BZ3500_MvSof-1268-A1-R1_Chr12-1g03650 [Microbotryum saponariae]|uniref:BZ3500_MvSof-1268-A1-R1_Chr12-1g03650 protein n=1 Tax=Microbotryum saponariae TaxID=289078 RepID=A0A2X0KSW2_9BASI|nr:BZ3500_MvSof-1268-A1-R1_Chr12-1g03650 [Microbotryum saponariae]SDA05243.1 BZ3501_MvSof-1269-A2-R1_Chr12-1g03227 [Microbotryum saponariae]